MVNLKPVSAVEVKFDPFEEHCKNVRDFMFYISRPKTLQTNTECKLKANIVCDRSKPTVTCNLDTGDTVVFKAENLSPLNILELFNKHISSLVPTEPPKRRLFNTAKVKIKPFGKKRGVVLLTGHI